MLQQLIYFIYVSFVCITWGFPFIALTKKNKTSIFEINPEFIIYSFFSGIVLTSFIAVCLSLITPLKYFYLPIFTLIPLAAGLFILSKSRVNFLLFKNTKLSTQTVSLSIFLLALFFLSFSLGSIHPVMEDMDLYHLQIIRWNQEYGTVPGVANLYLRYGFYSNWLYDIALFKLPFNNDNFLYLNISICIWFGLFLVNKIKGHTEKHQELKHRFFSILYFCILSFCLLEWKLFRGSSSSTSYDFPVTVFMLIVLLLITENIIISNSQKPEYLHILMLFSAGAAYFKISGAPIILICLVYLLITKHKPKVFLYFFTLVIFFTIPFFIKNFIQSGYFIFPYTYFPVFHPDWRVPESLMKEHFHYINLYNKYLNTTVTQSMWLATPNNKWISGWLSRQTLYDYLLIIMVLLSIPFYLLVNRKSILNKKVLLIYLTCLAALIAWFYSSPDPRFAYGLLLFTGFIIPALFISKFLSSPKLITLLLIYSIPIFIYAFKKIKPNFTIQPAGILKPALNTIIINNSKYYIPEKLEKNWNSRCYYSELPCIYELNPYLQQRTEFIKDGFRMNPIRDSSFILNYRY